MEFILEPVISALVETITSSLSDLGILGDNFVAEINQWKTVLQDLRAVIQDAEEKQANSEAIRNWLQDLMELVWDVDDIIEVFNYRVFKRQQESSSLSFKQISEFPFELLRNRKLHRKSNKIMKRLESLKRRKKTYNLLCLPVKASSEPRSSRLPSSSLQGNERVVCGRDKDKRAVGDLLTQSPNDNDAFGVIPIIGMGGLGKTTLARCVFNDNHLTSCFDIKAWACVSVDYDTWMITTQILKGVDPDFKVDFQDLNWIQNELHKRLSNKRFLIILDDLWNDKYDDWNTLRPPFSGGLHGSKIIVTTRSGKVADIVGNMEFIYPERLADEDCHTLLCEHAGLNPEENSVYGEMAKENSRKVLGFTTGSHQCRGSPSSYTQCGRVERNPQP